MTAAKAKEKAYELIESCLESVSRFLDRLKLSLSGSEVSLPLRNIYISILIDVLQVFAITTIYVRRGSLSTKSNATEAKC